MVHARHSGVIALQQMRGSMGDPVGADPERQPTMQVLSVSEPADGGLDGFWQFIRHETHVGSVDMNFCTSAWASGLCVIAMSVVSLHAAPAAVLTHPFMTHPITSESAPLVEQPMMQLPHAGFVVTKFNMAADWSVAFATPMNAATSHEAEESAAGTPAAFGFPAPSRP